MSENVDPQALNPGKVSKKGCEPKRVPFSIFARASQHVANLENLVPRHGENACRINSSMYSITGLLTHLFRGKIRGRPSREPHLFAPFCRTIAINVSVAYF